MGNLILFISINEPINAVAEKIIFVISQVGETNSPPFINIRSQRYAEINADKSGKRIERSGSTEKRILFLNLNAERIKLYHSITIITTA